MARISKILLILFLSPAFSPADKSFADFYWYTDEKGTIHITNDIGRIPKKFKKGMKVTREDELRKEETDKTQKGEENFPAMNENEVEKGTEEKRQNDGAEHSVYSSEKDRTGTGKVILYAVAVIVAIFLPGRLIKGGRYKIVLFLMISGLVLVFLLREHAAKSRERYIELKKSVTDVQEKMGRRSRERLKELNALEPAPIND